MEEIKIRFERYLRSMERTFPGFAMINHSSIEQYLEGNSNSTYCMANLGDIEIVQNENPNIRMNSYGTYMGILVDFHTELGLGSIYHVSSKISNVQVMGRILHPHTGNNGREMYSSFCTSGSELSSYRQSIYDNEIKGFVNDGKETSDERLDMLNMTLVVHLAAIARTESISGGPHKKMQENIYNTVSDRSYITETYANTVSKNLHKSDIDIPFQFIPRFGYKAIDNSQFDDLLIDLANKNIPELEEYTVEQGSDNQELYKLKRSRWLSTEEEVKSRMREFNFSKYYRMNGDLILREIIVEDYPDYPDIENKTFTQFNNLKNRLITKINNNENVEF